MQHVWESLAVA